MDNTSNRKKLFLTKAQIDASKQEETERIVVCEPIMQHTNDSDRFRAHDFQDQQTDAITASQQQIHNRVAKLLRTKEYADLIDAYSKLLEENEELRSKQST